jgi:hypothetical protein
MAFIEYNAPNKKKKPSRPKVIKTSAGKAQGASKKLTPEARKVSKTPKSTVAEYNAPKGKSTATKVAKKVVKATAKKAVVPPVSPNLFRTMIGFGARLATRVAAPVALAVGALHLVDPVMKHVAPKSKPWKSTPKLRASQKRMNKAIDKMGGKQTPQQQIHGGGYHTGLQPDKTKAVSPLILTGPVKTRGLTPEVEENKFTASGVKISTAFREPSMEKWHYTPIKTSDKKSKSEVVKKSAKPKVVKKSKVTTPRSERGDDYNYTPRKKLSTRKTDPASADGPGSAPKPLNGKTSPPKTETNIEDRFYKFMQDSSRGDRHLGAPKKKPLGMEDAFWDGASWVR